MLISLDFPKLLSPISNEQPTGTDLRKGKFSPIYQKARELRASARSVERQKKQRIEKSEKPDWQTIYQLSIEILSTQSKDLEVITWLIEALVREAGFSGLADGFKLARQLCEKFWDIIYPLPDEEGIISRIFSFTGLNGEEVEGVLITPLALAPLIENGKSEPYTLWHYYQALDLLKITDPEKRAHRIASGSISLEMIERALRESSADFLQKQQKTLSTCIQEFTALIQFFEEKCGHYTPPSSRILKQLNTCLECLNCLPAHKAISESLIEDTSETINLPLDEIQQSLPAREKILQTLVQAADFFRKTEPHSPLPYMLERAVRWAKTPLPTLLQEFVLDESTQKHINALIGIRLE